MPQVAADVRSARAKRLREVGERALERHLEAQIGRRVEVLAERGGVGRAHDFSLVATPGVAPGAMIEGVVTAREGMKLRLG